LKRVGGLWEQVASFESLFAAATRALRGKRSRPGATGFHFDLEGELLRLERELRDATYQPGAYRNFWIQDPKPRLISAAPFRDRVVHHALVAAIEPAIERRLIDHTYACRPGLGQHRALARFVDHAARYRYVLMMDVEKYFASIDLEVLRELLGRILKDRRVLSLCDLILENGAGLAPAPRRYFPGDGLFSADERLRGLPIGNLTSQLFANLMLDPIDHLATDCLRLRGYLRYMDDFACFSNDRRELEDARESIREALLDGRLRLQERKSRVRRTDEALTFLGFTTRSPNSSSIGSGPRQVSVRVAPRGVRAWRRRRRALETALAAGEISRADLERSFDGWAAHVAHASSGGLLRTVIL